MVEFGVFVWEGVQPVKRLLTKRLRCASRDCFRLARRLQYIPT